MDVKIRSKITIKEEMKQYSSNLQEIKRNSEKSTTKLNPRKGVKVDKNKISNAKMCETHIDIKTFERVKINSMKMLPERVEIKEID